jgi:hypothetical protein
MHWAFESDDLIDMTFPNLEQICGEASYLWKRDVENKYIDMVGKIRCCSKASKPSWVFNLLGVLIALFSAVLRGSASTSVYRERMCRLDTAIMRSEKC